MQEFNNKNLHRPVHETNADKNREINCLRYVSEVKGIPHTRFPKLYPIDAAFYHQNGDVRFFAEHRHRNIAHNKYGNIPMTVGKYAHGCLLSNTYSVPFVIIWEFDDGVYWKAVDKYLTATHFHGNKYEKDRDDPYDQEPVVLIPTQGMVRVY